MGYIKESLEDYDFSIEKALAGILNDKPVDDLSDDEINKAKEIVANLSFDDYISLTDALDRDDKNAVDKILSNNNVNISNMSESIKHILDSGYLDSDILLSEGFTYFGIFENELVRNKVLEFLDENNVEYMNDNTGHIQMKFDTREKAYKAETAISKIIKKHSSSYVRDDIHLDEKRKPFPDPGKKYRRFGKPKGLTGAGKNLRKLQKKNGGQGCFTESNMSAVLEANAINLAESTYIEELINHEEKKMSKKIEEGVMGIAPVPGLRRLRELAGLPPVTPSDDESVSDLVDEPISAPTDNSFAGPIVGDEVPDGAVDFAPSLENSIDEPVGDIESVSTPSLPAPVSSDVRSEIESAISTMLSKAPELKIADYKSVLSQAEDAVAQMRVMGSQYLKEGKKTETLREWISRQTGFKKALYSDSILANKKNK